MRISSNKPWPNYLGLVGGHGTTKPNRLHTHHKHHTPSMHAGVRRARGCANATCTLGESRRVASATRQYSKPCLIFHVSFGTKTRQGRGILVWCTNRRVRILSKATDRLSVPVLIFFCAVFVHVVPSLYKKNNKTDTTAYFPSFTGYTLLSLFALLGYGRTA